MSTDRPKTNWRRLLWEVLGAALLIAAVWGAWTFQEHRKTQALEQQALTHTEELQAVRQQLTKATTSGAWKEARAVFQTFAATAGPAIETGEGAADQAIAALIRLPGVRFAHLLLPDGQVLATTDRKLEATGQADERARWALDSEETRERAGSDGTLEIAGPLAGQDPRLSPILWLGYAATSP